MHTAPTGDINGRVSGLALIDWARGVAVRAHCDAKQMRRDPLYPLPYAFHPLRVSAMVARCGGSDCAIAAALLHDVLEDTPVTSEGWPADVTDLVVAVTHRPGESKLAAIKQLWDAKADAVLIKLADRYDNATAESNGGDYFRRPDVMESTEELLRIAAAHRFTNDKCEELIDTLEQMLREAKEQAGLIELIESQRGHAVQ